MPLYRTVSDRGLWKKQAKNENPQPQHFHKPSYIDKDKPVVTYSQVHHNKKYLIEKLNHLHLVGPW